MHRVGYPWPRVPFPLTRRACVNPNPRVSPSSWPLFPAHTSPMFPLAHRVRNASCLLTSDLCPPTSPVPMLGIRLSGWAHTSASCRGRRGRGRRARPPRRQGRRRRSLLAGKEGAAPSRRALRSSSSNTTKAAARTGAGGPAASKSGRYVCVSVARLSFGDFCSGARRAESRAGVQVWWRARHGGDEMWA